MEPVYDNGAMHLVSASVLTPITNRKYPYCGRVVHYQYTVFYKLNTYMGATLDTRQGFYLV